MYATPVRVLPDPKYTAEVVLLLTTLGAKRSEFNAGKRARDLLEIKRVHHKIIDFNRDARQAGTGEAENQAIQKLMVQGKLQTGDNKELSLPQIFIDGQYIGDATELQGLEDDGLLENILLRKACMKCNCQKRTAATTQCESCWAKLEEILPGQMTIEQALKELALLGEVDFDDEDDYGEDEDEDEDEDPPAAYEAATVAGATSSQAQVPIQPAATAAPSVAFQHTLGLGEAFRDASEVARVSTSEPPAKAVSYRVGDQVQYWSDTKSRWVECLVEGVREKDGGLVVYDLNCKKGALADKLRHLPADNS